MAKRPNTSAGISAGIKVWILFMLGFFFLGYSQIFSICFGLIAGIAGGTIAAWWNAKEDYLAEEETGDDVAEDEPDTEEHLAKGKPKRQHFQPYGRQPLEGAARRMGQLLGRDRRNRG